ncbi:MAG: sigma-54-dependent Fis family transcriptional regulator [Gammaproteobacteria bacterium]|nr:sigma-54-dependent Fis family transcriptional regulator [Gammaproteobacteria bacterium]MBL6999312.1 sigma-54-dependent Fis family transcriptional regulator [Gammaproteobacteria bacterium]
MSTLLIIDDDVAICRTLLVHFRSLSHQVITAHNINDGLVAAAGNAIDLILLDNQMPIKSGIESLADFREVVPDIPIIMITAYHDMETTIVAMQNGADDYIHKPVDINELDQAVERALLRSDEESTNLKFQEEDHNKRRNSRFSMAGHSSAMRQIYKTIGLIANKPVTVLISGESGTGKELVARAIHEASSRRNGPYVAVNCAALVETLLESDLFGHEKGAFTGAVNKHSGKFAMAQDGSLFLDEVGELSPSIQAKLLRVLQEKEYIPVGSTKLIQSNARIIAATNDNLEEKVKLGLFREDLYYRLQVVNITIPPLRERKEDLMDLIRTLLGRINREMHNSVCRLSMDVIDAFNNYRWPGNVRELENILTKAVALSPSDTITLDLIPEYISARENNPIESGLPIHTSLDEMEKYHVARVLNATHWHKGESCKILGVSRPRLRRIIKQHQLTNPEGNELDENDNDDITESELVEQ